LTKNYKQRPKYAKLLEHPFVVKSARNSVSVGAWYASLPISSPSGTKNVSTVATHTVGASNGSTPTTPQPVRSFFQHWTPEQATPTPSRAWRMTSSAHAGGSSSQPTSLETDFCNHSPYPRRRTIDASPPPPPVRRVSAENRWRPSPASSGNTSPIVLQRFQHQSQQRRSRVDLHATPRHRSLSKEHSVGRSPEPPPRTSRPNHSLLGNHEVNGSMDLERHMSLQESILHPPSPFLVHDRLQEGRSQSLTRAELRNGYRKELNAPAPPPTKHHHDDQSWLHSLAGLVKRRLSGYVKWHHVAARDRHPERAIHEPDSARESLAHRQPYPLPHPLPHVRYRWNHNESWSVPASPLPPRAPPPRPAPAD
ncbi:serine/arginine repetitive matrix protein 1-like, partial [Hyposmocoma kahamanoa]|uniref:serine/arginine repetitive matrix protein 1-like n=1 Tax=Hyposmocoma kahamanoa TaxID=1477025 RepID=UPI000E6D85E1